MKPDPKRTVIFSADDFGLCEAVNEGIERAHTEGVLSHASLMVGADAAGDAVARAKRLPNLKVGLHLVVIEGRATLPHAQIPHLTDPETNWFPSDQLKLGLKYAFHPAVRRELDAEIEAQFQSFASTGLPLDHANAHKHMHLHPTVGAALLKIGKRHGLTDIRVPTEPPIAGIEENWGATALRHWTKLLRHQVRRADMTTTDHCFGLAWSGHMTTDRVRRLLAELPPGMSEIYFHPAARRDATLSRLMPTYAHVAELECLRDRQSLGGKTLDISGIAAR